MMQIRKGMAEVYRIDEFLWHNNTSQINNCFDLVICNIV